MPRVKRGKTHLKKRKKLLAKTKGYMWGRKNILRRAKEAVIKAGAHAYADRRKKKRTARALFQIKINAMSREIGLSYSKLANLLKKNNVSLDRKILSDLAVNNKEVFKKIVEDLKGDTARS